VLLLPLPFPFCNDGQAATVKLANLLKHSVYFGLGDQPTFIGEIDHSVLVPPFGAPGPEPNKARDRAQRSDLQKQFPCQQKPLHFLLPVVKLAALLTQLSADCRGKETTKYGECRRPSAEFATESLEDRSAVVVGTGGVND
jgi:hypothetical protein